MIKSSPGYIPDPVWWKDWIWRIVGAPMLLKRLQMPAINQALAIMPGMKALDVGCGSGYMAYQMAFDGAIVYGVDISEIGFRARSPLAGPDVRSRATRSSPRATSRACRSAARSSAPATRWRMPRARTPRPR